MRLDRNWKCTICGSIFVDEVERHTDAQCLQRVVEQRDQSERDARSTERVLKQFRTSVVVAFAITVIAIAINIYFTYGG